MARRKEVFQSKVFQKLYPPASTLHKDPISPHVEESVSSKTQEKRKAEDNTQHGKKLSAANPGRRMYTVLPPPPDFVIHSEGSVKQINVDDPTEDENLSGEDLDEESEEEQKQRRRRRRKRKWTPHQDSVKSGSSLVTESSAGQSQTPVDGGGERISRNKKRKLKKKRHREKLLSMGLMPRAAALEFTFQKDEGVMDEDRKAAEVSDFLRTTMDIYLSDSSLHAAKVPRLSTTVDDLLGSIASEGRQHCVLRELYNLKVFVQHRKTDQLQKALKELHSSCVLSAEESAAVVSLFQYWITDILPMQGEEKTALSTTHP